MKKIELQSQPEDLSTINSKLLQQKIADIRQSLDVWKRKRSHDDRVILITPQSIKQKEEAQTAMILTSSGDTDPVSKEEDGDISGRETESEDTVKRTMREFEQHRKDTLNALETQSSEEGEDVQDLKMSLLEKEHELLTLESFHLFSVNFSNMES